MEAESTEENKKDNDHANTDTPVNTNSSEIEDKTDENEKPKTKCSDDDVFKKPTFIGKLPRFNKPLKPVPELKDVSKPQSARNVEVEIKIGVRKESEKIISKKSPAQRIAEKNVPLPYKEPPWSGLPRHEYHLEVLKGGIIVNTIPLVKPYIVFGRISQCDVLKEHPSISRFHCILQYRVESTPEEPCGFYIYDLDSTHGTFLNRMQLKPKCYQRVHVGHFIKVGGSTRMYILQGPEIDEEQESELSATELMKMAAEKNKSKEEAQSSKHPDVETDGISWGMGEDASEEKENSDEEGEYNFTVSEELFLEDPKKTLRGWFEREGYDAPNYEAKEIGPAKYSCKLELPIESLSGKPVIASIDHTGKKKDAVVQCALEACRILNAHGVLRQAKHESHQKKKKDWSENDYYDSDEDDFLDRTGDIQKKRMKRMMEEGVDNTTVVSYESLKEEYDKIIEELGRLEMRLKYAEKVKQLQMNGPEEGTEDLESFMENLKSQMPDKHKRVAWKLRVVELKKEELRVRKLVNIARPAHIPEIKPYSKDEDEAEKSSKSKTIKLNAASRLASQVPQKIKSSLNQPRIMGTHRAFIEEEPVEKRRLPKLTDSDDIQPVPYAKSVDNKPIKPKGPKFRQVADLMDTYQHKNSLFKLNKNTEPDSNSESNKNNVSESKNTINSSKTLYNSKHTINIDNTSFPSSSDTSRPENMNNIKMEGITKNTFENLNTSKSTLNENSEESYVVNKSKSEKTDDEIISVKKDPTPPKKRVLGPMLPPTFFDKKPKLQTTLSGINTNKKTIKPHDSKYETWTPPSDQTGDGRTKLNDKYGY